MGAGSPRLAGLAHLLPRPPLRTAAARPDRRRLPLRRRRLLRLARCSRACVRGGCCELVGNPGVLRLAARCTALQPSSTGRRAVCAATGGRHPARARRHPASARRPCAPPVSERAPACTRGGGLRRLTYGYRRFGVLPRSRGRGRGAKATGWQPAGIGQGRTRTAGTHTAANPAQHAREAPQSLAHPGGSAGGGGGVHAAWRGAGQCGRRGAARAAARLARAGARGGPHSL